jgi:hypothetical protein
MVCPNNAPKEIEVQEGPLAPAPEADSTPRKISPPHCRAS